MTALGPAIIIFLRSFAPPRLCALRDIPSSQTCALANDPFTKEMTRGQKPSFVAALLFLSLAVPARAAEARVPVVLDTDIGDDIDDTWALVTLLKCPQFDLKLVTTTFGKAEYRAKISAAS